MQRLARYLFLLLALALLLAACTQSPDTTVPTVTMTTSLAGAHLTAGESTTIAGTATDNVSIVRVEIIVNGEVAAEVTPQGGAWTFDWKPTAPGEYTILARAFDAAGNHADSEPIKITVQDKKTEDPEDPGTPDDKTAPTVAITNPDSGEGVLIGSPLLIEGSAEDDVEVVRIDVRIDGETISKVLPKDGAWSFNWVPDVAGKFEIRAHAYDAAGNSGLSEIIVIHVSSGSVTGIITRTNPADVATVTAQAVSPNPAPVVPGELFVVFGHGRPQPTFGTASTDEGFTFDSDGGFTYQGIAFEQLRQFASPATELVLYRAPGLNEQATRDLVEELRATGVVASVFPNWILSQQATEPDDTNYELQKWHYEQLNLPEAWDIETGEGERLTVAVLDTGSYPHVDIEWGKGANFVNWDIDTGLPEEGDIDEPNTLPGGSPHGTHVAGTIGALTDNGVGVAGVNWDVNLVPVKVLGASGSGSFDGILEGLFWAGGFRYPEYNGHFTDHPAQVVNMSLGGAIFEACPPAIDAIFAGFAELGTITVVAAGNDGSPSDIFFPANCPSVITVGATGLTGARSYYSNYGAFIDVMAPGGDADYPHPSLGSYAGVLSTVSGNGYGIMQGTSMASPHVAGVVSLMLAREPGLGLEDIRARLHEASYPLSYAECSVPAYGFDGQNVCGAGLLDAAAALLGASITDPEAFAYAIPYDGDTPPALGIGNLSSLEHMAPYRAKATRLDSGDYTFTLEGLEPGRYLVVGLELRDAANGISNVDRVGFVEEIEVSPGEDEDELLIVVEPIYVALR